MLNRNRIIPIGLFILLLGFLLAGEALQAENPPQIEAQLISEVSSVRPGDKLKIGIKIKIEPGWHIYWKKSGDAGLPTQIHLDIPKGLEISPWLWPKPSIFQEEGNILTIGYKEKVLFVADVSLSPRWDPGNPIELKGRVDWLACKKSCIPGKTSFQTVIQTGHEKVFNIGHGKLFQEESPYLLTTAEEKLVFDEYLKRKSKNDFISQIGSSNSSGGLALWLALVFALFGGLLLNIMPCVLPVLSIKALRFLGQGKIPGKEIWRQSLLYLAGVLGSFTALGLVVVSIKLAGQEIGWGFQFQEPRFIVFMTAVVFTFGLSLLGFYEFTFTVSQDVEKISHKEGWVGPFGEGLLATILATPCTAPFLGPAIGFSFSQPPFIILSFFWLIGLGLASPYLLLAAFPAWTKILPKPGRWMETFKKLMALPLFGTAIWLIWILNRQVAPQAVLGILIVLGAIGVGIWAMAKWGSFEEPLWKRRLVGTISFLLIISTYFLFVEPKLKSFPSGSGQSKNTKHLGPGIIEWQPFSIATLKSALQKKEVVFVDFTADWCLTCKLNEKNVLNSINIARAFKATDVLALKADWTNRDEEITDVIRRLGRSGVPVYVFFKDGDPANPIILPEILTEKILLDKLSEIVKTSKS